MIVTMSLFDWRAIYVVFDHYRLKAIVHFICKNASFQHKFNTFTRLGVLNDREQTHQMLRSFVSDNQLRDWSEVCVIYMP